MPGIETAASLVGTAQPNVLVIDTSNSRIRIASGDETAGELASCPLPTEYEEAVDLSGK